MRVALLVARIAVLAVLGAGVGLASVLLHGLTPGLLLGLTSTALATYALPAGPTSRFPFVVGWVAVLAGVLLPRSGGGFLIAATARGYTLLVFGLVLLLAAILTLRPLREPPEPVPAPDPQPDPGAPDPDE